MIWLRQFRVEEFYNFCSYTLVVKWEYILANLTNSQEPEPHVLDPLEPKPDPLEKNTRSHTRLGKYSGAGVAWVGQMSVGPLPCPPPTVFPCYCCGQNWMSSSLWKRLRVNTSRGLHCAIFDRYFSRHFVYKIRNNVKQKRRVITV